MLVLSRKPKEEIVIVVGGQEIAVRVLAVARAGVRLGIEAPKSIAVHRREVRDRIAAENARPKGPLTSRRAGPGPLPPLAPDQVPPSPEAVP